jgi:hypothetical protein
MHTHVSTVRVCHDKESVSVKLFKIQIFVDDIVHLHLKVHLHEILDFCFFSYKASLWSPDFNPSILSNINSNSPRYSNSKVILHIIRTRGIKFFCHARIISKVFPGRV